MITFPTYIQVLAGNYSENYQSNYLRSEFDRGIPKQRKISCTTLKKVTFDIFVCDENKDAFVDFFNNEGRDWFQFPDPGHSPAQLKKARIVAGDLPLKAQGEDFQYWTTTLTLEMYA